MIRNRSRIALTCALALTGLCAAPVKSLHAQPANADSMHEELRALRDGMLDAWQRRDLDALLEYVDPDVVVIWQNGAVNRGHGGIREFYDRMLGGEDAIIANMDSTLEMEELSILHGDDSAVAYGTLHDEVTFGRTLASANFIGADTTISLDSRWTAALSRKAGRWQVTAFHVSANMFSNPVLSLATAATRWIALIFGIIVGLIIAFVVMRFIGPKGGSAEA